MHLLIRHGRLAFARCPWHPTIDILRVNYSVTNSVFDFSESCGERGFMNWNLLSVGAGEAADCHVEVSAVGAEHCFVYAVDYE